MNGDNIWKWVAGFLAAAVLTLAGTAVGAVSSKGASDQRVRELINLDSPYAQDRDYVKTTLATLVADNLQLKQNVGELLKAQNEERLLIERLEALLQSHLDDGMQTTTTGKSP